MARHRTAAKQCAMPLQIATTKKKKGDGLLSVDCTAPYAGTALLRCSTACHLPGELLEARKPRTASRGNEMQCNAMK